MKTKTTAVIFFAAIIFISCSTSTSNSTRQESKLPIEGTWKLLTGTLVDTNGVATVTDYTHDTSFIKVINADYFAFMGHDLNKGKDSMHAYYSSGGGKYDLHDSNYTEHLEYCNDRQWEANDFNFTISISNDTLTIKGVEKVEGTNINRVNTEKYFRLKD